MSHPLVTVLIDTYNHEQFIEHAIVSVLEQDLENKDWEILVIDDGSTDRTPDIIRKFSSQVRYIRKQNGGQASAFNLGIPEAKGEIIAFLDGDDWWRQDKLRRVLKVLETSPEVGAVGHGIIEAYDSGTKRQVAISSPLQLYIQDIDSALTFQRVRSQLGTSRFTARKSLLEGILPVPDDLVVEADEFMFTLAAATVPTIILSECLTYYRLHGNNLYQFSHYDEAKLRRKNQVHQSLLRNLPPKMTALGLSADAIQETLKLTWIDAERGRLALEGGSPWETWRVEHIADQRNLATSSWKKLFFEYAVLALALLLPPQIFYRLRRSYSEQSLFNLWRTQPSTELPLPDVDLLM
ncbi:MAG: glycosyltransferase [Cyanobacteria bacterium J06634_6]